MESLNPVSRIPYPVFPNMRRYAFDLESQPISVETLASYDCVLIATDHDVFDYQLIADRSQLIIDTRGRYREPNPKIIRA